MHPYDALHPCDLYQGSMASGKSHTAVVPKNVYLLYMGFRAKLAEGVVPSNSAFPDIMQV